LPITSQRRGTSKTDNAETARLASKLLIYNCGSAKINYEEISQIMRKPKLTTGRKLRGAWSIPAKRAYFHQDGTFYEVPIRFSAALCDVNGFVLFDSLEKLESTEGVSVASKVNIPNGIFRIEGYQKSNLPIPN
jgi:hypothetical protein